MSEFNPKKWLVIMRCPVDDTGRNSVIPSTNPNITESVKDMSFLAALDFASRVSGKGEPGVSAAKMRAQKNRAAVHTHKIILPGFDMRYDSFLLASRALFMVVGSANPSWLPLGNPNPMRVIPTGLSATILVCI